MEIPKDLILNVKREPNFPQRESKKNLANLSDEELAKLSPEEIEQARQAQQNLLAIKKATKEINAIDKEEQWKTTVEQYAKEHNFSVEEAAEHLRKDTGGDKLSSLLQMMKFFQPAQPKENPVVEAIEEAVAARLKDILFPAPGTQGEQPGASSGNQPNPIATAVTQAKNAGVQSIFLPDGTQLFFKNQNSSAIAETIETAVKEQLHKVISDTLLAILNPGRKRNSGGGDNALSLLDPDLAKLKGLDPEIVKVYYENRNRELDRQAADARSQGRDEAVTAGFALLGALVSPEGFETARKKIDEAKAMARKLRTSPEEKSEGETIKTTCWKCSKDFIYGAGNDPVCPTCHLDQRVKCPRCETVFIPPSAEEIVCPRCHASLELPSEKGKEPLRKKGDEEEQPRANVGSGILG